MFFFVVFFNKGKHSPFATLSVKTHSCEWQPYVMTKKHPHLCQVRDHTPLLHIGPLKPPCFGLLPNTAKVQGFCCCWITNYLTADKLIAHFTADFVQSNCKCKNFQGKTGKPTSQKGELSLNSVTKQQPVETAGRTSAVN